MVHGITTVSVLEDLGDLISLPRFEAIYPDTKPQGVEPKIYERARMIYIPRPLFGEVNQDFTPVVGDVWSLGTSHFKDYRKDDIFDYLMFCSEEDYPEYPKEGIVDDDKVKFTRLQNILFYETDWSGLIAG